MSGRSSLVILLVASLPWTPPASAAEAYLCGPDTVVYVKAEELELKKRTDPCIARYYGMTVAPAQQPSAQAAAPVAAPAAQVDTAPHTKTAPSQSPAKMRALSDPDVAPAKAPRPSRIAAIAAPDTDFRNVRILNPASADSAWFRHER